MTNQPDLAASPLDSLLGFNGERIDPTLGSYHLGNGYRLYNPTLRRFTAPDNMSPFGAGGINPYAYCEGDPINNTDPTGHVSLFRRISMRISRRGVRAAEDIVTDGTAILEQEELRHAEHIAVHDARHVAEDMTESRAGNARRPQLHRQNGVTGEHLSPAQGVEERVGLPTYDEEVALGAPPTYDEGGAQGAPPTYDEAVAPGAPPAYDEAVAPAPDTGYLANMSEFDLRSGTFPVGQGPYHNPAWHYLTRVEVMNLRQGRAFFAAIRFGHRSQVPPDFSIIDGQRNGWVDAMLTDSPQHRYMLEQANRKVARMQSDGAYRRQCRLRAFINRL